MCLWWVAGAEVPVKVVVAEVEGYRQRFYLVSSATELTGVEMVEGFAGRFRQEDVFRDLKQRLGWEECRAWTQAPIERTSQVQWVTLSLLRLAQFRLEAEGSRIGGCVRPGIGRRTGPVCWTWSGCCDGMARRSGTCWRNGWARRRERPGNRRRERLGVRGEDRWPGRLGPEIRPLPSESGEMRGRRPEEAELDMIT